MRWSTLYRSALSWVVCPNLKQDVLSFDVEVGAKICVP